MHELAVTQSILKIAVSEAEKHGAAKVLEIRIKIGQMSDIMPEYIQEYYNIVSKGTAAENAKLCIERIPVIALCKSCNRENPISRMSIKCPDCGSADLKIISGKEFFVDSLEVE